MATRDVQTVRQVLQQESVVHTHDVRHTVTAVNHHSGRGSARVQREHGLRLALQSTEAKLLEHDLGHLLSVVLWVQRRFRQHDAHIVRLDATPIIQLDTHLLLECVLPELFHIIPARNHSILDGICDIQGSHRLRTLVSNQQVLEFSGSKKNDTRRVMSPT